MISREERGILPRNRRDGFSFARGEEKGARNHCFGMGHKLRGPTPFLRPLAGQVKAPRGAKAWLVLAAIREQSGEFRLTDIEQACPGVGREWIRSLLTDLKAAGDATCQGKGPAARWRYLGSKGSNS